MMSKKLALTLSAALFLSGPLLGDAWNKRTVLTFSEPVEIPGVILPAGQYVFKLADFASNRNVVQVFNADEDQIQATILAIPSYRLEPKDDSVILFEERRADRPQAIHAWFYPGEIYGHEFVYPKGQALEAAQSKGQPVMPAEAQPPERPATVEETQVAEQIPETAPTETPVELWETPAAEAILPSENVEIAEVVQPEASADRAELPQTAGSLPFFSLLGAGALGIAGVLKVFRMRNVE